MQISKSSVDRGGNRPARRRERDGGHGARHGSGPRHRPRGRAHARVGGLGRTIPAACECWDLPRPGRLRGAPADPALREVPRVHGRNGQPRRLIDATPLSLATKPGVTPWRQCTLSSPRCSASSLRRTRRLWR